MAGEYTAKIRDYSNIIKSNDIVTEDGEVIKLHKDCLESIAMDFINWEEQRKEKLQDVISYKKDKSEIKEKLNELCGSFYFNFYKRLLGKVKPQYLIRLLYLSCFMDYENRLIIRKPNKNIPIYESELKDLLGLGKSEYYMTRIELVKYDLIKINEDKTIIINPTYCKKGGIMKNKKVEKVRVFEEAIKELYENTKPTEHKQLALLFDFLPFINYKWNIICKDNTEITKEFIEPYTLKELAELLGQTNITRFKSKLDKLKLNGKSVVCINRINGKEFITINPKVYYKGGRTIEDMKELEGIIAVFEASENIK